MCEAAPLRPPYEPATALLLERLAGLGLPEPLGHDTLSARRRPVEQVRAELERARPGTHLSEERLRRVASSGSGGDSRGDSGGGMELVVCRPNGPQAGSADAGPAPSGAPLILSLHSGGRVMGNRYNDLLAPTTWAERLGAVVVSPEYRLAPEHPSPAAEDDCYAALLWAADNAERLGADPRKIIVVGQSAGGGLAASLAIRARDEGGPRALGYLLDYPMLDDRTGLPGPHGLPQPASARQYVIDGLWPERWNSWAWQQVLPSTRGTSQVSAHQAAGRGADQPLGLADLPPVFLSVASAELFRDEVVAFASALWRDGGDCELHVWPGATHAMEHVSATWLRQGLEAARRSWLERLVSAPDPRASLDQVVSEGTFPALTAES